LSARPSAADRPVVRSGPVRTAAASGRVPLWMAGRTCSTSVSTGCALPAAGTAGSAPSGSPTARLRWSGRRAALKCWYGEGSGPTVRPARRSPWGPTWSDGDANSRIHRRATIGPVPSARRSRPHPARRPPGGPLRVQPEESACGPSPGGWHSSAMLVGVCGRRLPWPLSAVTSFRGSPGRRPRCPCRHPARARPPADAPPPMSCRRSTS